MESVDVSDYVIRVHASPLEIDAQAWDALLYAQAHATPFMRHAFLAALHSSGSAIPETGWTPQFITITDGGQLIAACPLYVKAHSYGEYVFDWAWADAYARHNVAYYPKAVVAVPFTPVPGARLLASNADARNALVQAITQLCAQHGLSSAHLLFGANADIQAALTTQWMPRQTVQFHWTQPAVLWRDFEDFLHSLTQEKRKKIRQERRKVSDAGVSFRAMQGEEISKEDWDFFYRCYERTYLEHGNAPYLTRGFFEQVSHTLSTHWLLFIARRNGRDIASSLIALNQIYQGVNQSFGHTSVAYGRYWGALERVDCLHFEACYYQPIAWCIEHHVRRFEGGAQGEHKMARALLPTETNSAHWLEHPAFANAVGDFLQQESERLTSYQNALHKRTPFKPAGQPTKTS